MIIKLNVLISFSTELNKSSSGKHDFHSSNRRKEIPMNVFILLYFYMLES